MLLDQTDYDGVPLDHRYMICSGCNKHYTGPQSNLGSPHSNCPENGIFNSDNRNEMNRWCCIFLGKKMRAVPEPIQFAKPAPIDFGAFRITYKRKI